MDILDKDERTIYIFALRYACGRRTAAFCTVAEAISKRLNSFYGYDLNNIIDEVDHACRMYPEWKNENALEIAEFKANIYDELKKRE